MTQPIVEELDRELFDSLGRRGAIPSPQIQAARAMTYGQLIALSHEGFKACPTTPGSCSLLGSVRNAIKKSRLDATFVLKHLPDGRLGVACFAKEDKQ